MADKKLSATGFPGVYRRANGTVRVRVWYEGTWIYERVRVPATPAGYREAARIRQEVNALSKQGIVRWGDWFPDSTKKEPEKAAPTFEEVARGWLRRKRRAIKPSTLRGYTKSVNLWCRIFGPMLITEIRRSHVLDAIDVLDWESGKTMANAMTTLRATFDEAVIDELIHRNPAQHIELPRSQRKPCDPLSHAEMRAVLDQLANDSWLEYFEVAFGTGMRTSELAGLRWPDVDLKRGTVRVHSARTDGVDTEETKTRVERTLELKPLALRALKRQRVKVLGNGHVFLNPNTGEPINSDQTPRKVWNRMLRDAGVKKRRAYETRHTHATLRLAAGEDLIAVSKDLGHKRPSMTLDHYAGWIKGQDAELARVALL